MFVVKSKWKVLEDFGDVIIISYVASFYGRKRWMKKGVGIVQNVHCFNSHLLYNSDCRKKFVPATLNALPLLWASPLPLNLNEATKSTTDQPSHALQKIGWRFKILFSNRLCLSLVPNILHTLFFHLRSSHWERCFIPSWDAPTTVTTRWTRLLGVHSFKE